MSAAFVGLWSHALAAILYGALAIWQLRHWNGDQRNRPLVAAFAVMSVWAIFMALLGPDEMLSGLAESARNLTFLAFMYGIVRGAADKRHQQGVRFVYAAVAGVIGLQIVIAGLLPDFATDPVILAALTSTAQVIGLTIAAGSLVLVHNLYGQAAPNSRWGIQLPAAALAAMWAYDLHVYTVAYMTRQPAADLFAMRGAVASAIVPLFALASRRNPNWRVQISRAATFQSLSVLAILAYFILMMSATRAMEVVGGDWMRLGQIGIVFVMSLAALVLLPSGKARAWFRVVTAKHLFEHRYDYREEWLRFTRTLGTAGIDEVSLEERIVKAIADIAGAPSGLLLVPDEQYRLDVAAQWNWPAEHEQPHHFDAVFARALEASGHIVEFDSLADGAARMGGESVPVPPWMRAAGAWAGIPLVHAERLVGLVLVAEPHVRRRLDWEDFDLFKTAGTQAASTLAEARGQEALANAQRFDEFNRRFAFIMHDIKNLVSQLSLVARNAERHADNPEFRADMIATLQSSVGKMNDLLARLSRGRTGEVHPPQPTAVHPIVAAIAEAKRRQHRIFVEGDCDLSAMADPSRLHQALGHIVQNAIDASPAGAPVTVRSGRDGDEATIEVIDQGSGMSADFIRSRLFQPFASTKEAGFGVGGREGSGSRFAIILPAAGPALKPQQQRMSA
jgi:putative PEP-CTERM system histidine kinase